jgi:hypothetical protein
MSTNTQAISDDIMQVAGKLTNTTIRNYERNRPANIARDAIAKAIHDAVMAERERCARLMEDDGEWTFAGDPAAMAIFEDVRELAADAIRAAPKAEG